MGFEKAGEAYFSKDEKYIIFQAVPEGKTQYQMYVMNLNEGIPKNGKHRRRSLYMLVFFVLMGKRFYFPSSHEDVLGKKNTRLSSDRYSWDLTPYMNIYEANLDGTCLKKLTHGPGLSRRKHPIHQMVRASFMRVTKMAA